MLTLRDPTNDVGAFRMIIRQLSAVELSENDGPEPAFQIFLRSQKQVTQSYLPILQSAHSHLAGELAASLLPGIFGPLPVEVIEAVRQHDYGWISSDLRQLDQAPEKQPRPFPDLSVEEAMPSWISSVRLAQTSSPLAGILISRHFCVLSKGDDDDIHHRFRRQEEAWREPMERALPYLPGDLDRWTAALGFCDLLSLYLCSGARQPAEFPFCHPADHSARRHARKAVLSWEGETLQFVPPVIVPGTRVSQTMIELRGGKAVSLQWVFDPA